MHSASQKARTKIQNTTM